MPVPYLIIDGYNLMHAAGIARRSYAPGDLGRCRRRLNQKVLSLLKPDVIARTTIVYDAFESPTNDQRFTHFEGLNIVFAPRGTDADSEIERLLRVHSAPRQVVVVSSDHRLHKAAGRRKAKCIDSDEFLASLESDTDAHGSLETEVQAPPMPKPQAPHRSDTADLEHWLQNEQADSEERIFDDDYLNDLRREFQ